MRGHWGQSHREHKQRTSCQGAVTSSTHMTHIPHIMQGKCAAWLQHNRWGGTKTYGCMGPDRPVPHITGTRHTTSKHFPCVTHTLQPSTCLWAGEDNECTYTQARDNMQGAVTSTTPCKGHVWQHGHRNNRITGITGITE